MLDYGYMPKQEFYKLFVVYVVWHHQKELSAKYKKLIVMELKRKPKSISN